MAKYVFLIMVSPVEGKTDDFNAWLDTHHIPEVLQTKGFKTCTRYEHAPEDAANPRSPARYMHYYDVETDDLSDTLASLKETLSKSVPVPDALDRTTMFTAWYKTKA